MSKRDSEREVERSGGSRSPMAKGNERKLKERSNESKIKMENGNIRRGSEYVHKQLKCPRERVSASEGRWARCRARRA